MNNDRFDKIKKDFEKGILRPSDITEKELEEVLKHYRNEIAKNKIDIKNTKNEIKKLKNKIDNIV